MASGTSQSASGGKILMDHYGRKLHYLRISLTDRCNLRCIYCMPQKGVAKLDHEEVLSLEETFRVARLAVGLGVDKIRLTGGEPLIRRNIETLLKNLDALRPRPDLRITTNALLLADKLPILKKYGVSTVNISLDTLKPERYGRIVGLKDEYARNAFNKVWKGIRAALDGGGIKVKLNVVALYGVNQDEILDFARLTMEMKLAVRFIEYMPVGRHKPFEPEKFLAAKDILDELSCLGPTESLPSLPGDGPARRYRLKGAPGELGVISSLSSHFCEACNRLRLTADGRLVPCLFSENSLDLRTALRNKASDQELIEILLAAADAKPKAHTRVVSRDAASGCPMSQLGG